MRDVIHIPWSLLIVLLTFAWGISLSAESQALRFVEEMELGSNLSQMAESVAKSTTSYAVVEDALGATEAEAILRRELRRAAEEVQKEWNQNLALSYEEYFTEAQLQSLSEERSKSPHIKRLISHQSKVAEAMRRRSSTLLKKVATAALVATMEAVPNEVQ